MAHRFIKDTNIYKEIGIIVISIDSKVLDEICSDNRYSQGNYNIKGITYI